MNIDQQSITLFISLIGALAWLPFLYEIIQKPQLEAKFLSLIITSDMQYKTYDPFKKSNITLSGIGYITKIAIVSLKKNFAIKRVEVFIKYPSGRELMNGTINYAQKYNITFANKVKKTFKIPPSEHINSLIVLENGKQVSVFIPFIVDKSVDENFEFLELRFYESNGSVKTIKFDIEDIDIKNMYIEERYWEQQPNPPT